METKKPPFDWKPSPQPSAEEFAKMMREAPYKKVSKEFGKTLYMIWADQDRIRAEAKKKDT